MRYKFRKYLTVVNHAIPEVVYTMVPVTVVLHFLLYKDVVKSLFCYVVAVAIMVTIVKPIQFRYNNKAITVGMWEKGYRRIIPNKKKSEVASFCEENNIPHRFEKRMSDGMASDYFLTTTWIIFMFKKDFIKFIMTHDWASRD